MSAYTVAQAQPIGNRRAQPKRVVVSPVAKKARILDASGAIYPHPGRILSGRKRRPPVLVTPASA